MELRSLYKLATASILLLMLLSPSASQDSQQFLRMPPSITRQPEREIVFVAGMEVTLQCEASGTPEPEFNWHQDGTVVNKNSPDFVWNKGTLIISTTTANYEGEWQCFAENMYGKSMSARVNLRMVSFSDYPPNQPIKELTGTEGENFKVICDSLKSFPPPTITWVTIKTTENDKSDGTPVEITNRIQIDEDGHLYFANLLPEDARDGNLYMCKLYNPVTRVSKGGSLTRISVTPSAAEPRPPVLQFSTESPLIGLRTKSVELKCIFSGNSAPKVQWLKKGGSLPFGRHRYENSGTTLILDPLEESDEGEYECKGTNPQASNAQVIQLVVDSEPVFVRDADRPMNENVTEGDTAEFTCHADAEPTAVVTWFVNGDVITSADPGPRRTISENGLKLSIENVCKDCSEDGGDYVTDLMNVQCEAENEHNYAFADAYLNILKRTLLTVKPEGQEIDLLSDEDILLPCAAETDDSTPLTLMWERDGKEIQPEEGKIEILEDHTLRLVLENQDEDNRIGFAGKYTCIATNAYSTDSATAELTLPEAVAPVKGASMMDMWWIFLIIALILLILLLICCCCLCMQRNKGDSYPVDEKERAQGNDPLKELEEDGYHDYQRPEDVPIKGSRASLTSTIKLDSDDEGSLNEYGGDLDTGKFNEDGSFIGQYIDKDKKRPKDSEV